MRLFMERRDHREVSAMLVTAFSLRPVSIFQLGEQKSFTLATK
jgi:hypothetical protein